MNQNENHSLRALEHLMEEFFNSSTTNCRKREIENQLNAFSAQKDCWKYCVDFVKHTGSQYVSMYALSTIETVINRRWNWLAWEDRVQLRSALQSYIIEQDAGAPPFIRNKLAKLLVDIARLDWPHFYPEFFTNIIQLLQSENGQLLGLILLRTASEELTSPRPDLSSYRKEELSRLLQQNIPQVLQILATILDVLSKKTRHYTTATPPPSPTHPGLAPNLVQEISAASFRPDGRTVTREVLATMQHLFTWVQLSQVPVAIVNVIFNFTKISSCGLDNDDMCVLAMSTLNELLYRKCVPPGTQDLFIQIYHNTVELLKDLTGPGAGKIESLGSDFMEKLSELLALMIEQHLWRLESELGFSALEFLELLFQLTMQLPTVDCYLHCLNVWAAFIKQFKPQNAEKYSEALLSLVMAVLNKMQFTCNMMQLQEICDNDPNESNETEWTMFINTSIETVALIAEFFPIETFNRVLAQWKTANDVFCMLENVVDMHNRCLTLQHSETQRLRYVLKDLSSLTQTLARLSVFFIDQESENLKQLSPVIDNLLVELVQSASMATNLRFNHLKMNDDKLVTDFTQVHAQIFAALKTWWPWYNLSSSYQTKSIQNLIDITIPILKSTDCEPAKVTHSASHLLLSITSTIFPPHLISMVEFVQFIACTPEIKYANLQCREVVLCAVTNVLLKPWGNLNQIDSDKRNQMIAAFFGAICKDFMQLTAVSDEHRVKEVVPNVLQCLTSVVDNASNYALNSKRLLFLALRESIEQALNLLPIYSKCREINEQILAFFLNVLRVLQQQMGAPFVKQAVDVFLNVAVRGLNVSDFYGLDKLLRILQLIVEAPGGSAKNYLPDIIELCLKNICPILIAQSNENPDAIIAMIELLHSILLHRWGHFYVSQIRLGNSPGCSDAEPSPDSLRRPEQLLAVLQIFGQSLLQPDINTFRSSLSSLENLNHKWKLYHKAMFKNQLLCQFLSVLLQTLIDKSHDLLTDDILLALYNMAAVNFTGFFTAYLPTFIDTLEGLTQEQRDSTKCGITQETDMPTFVHHIHRMTSDLRCFKLCNVNQQPGPVAL